MMLLRICCLAVKVLNLAMPGRGQGSHGGLAGVISDPTAAMVAGAAIRVMAPAFSQSARQASINLPDNAIRYTETGSVTLRLADRAADDEPANWLLLQGVLGSGS